jgi:hypothetical protein
MPLEAQLRDLNDRYIKVLEHLGAIHNGYNGPNLGLPGAGDTTYTRPGPNFPRAGTDPIDIGDPYDPTGKGHQPKTKDDGKGLPPDGTGTGPLPNTGLPSDNREGA